MLDDACEVVRNSVWRQGQMPHAIEGSINERSFETFAQYDESGLNLV
jgi:hypothetical protein